MCEDGGPLERLRLPLLVKLAPGNDGVSELLHPFFHVAALTGAPVVQDAVHEGVDVVSSLI